MAELWRLIPRHLTENDVSGQGLVDYALIIAFVSLAVIGALAVFGTKVAFMFNGISNSIPI